MTAFYERDNITLFCANALELLATLDDGSVGLIASDPPYHRVKPLDWDRQWDTADAYLDWIGELCAEFQRVLRVNGSLYLFASPQMASRVEVKVAEYFNVLNHIVWMKNDGSGYGTGSHSKPSKEALRSYFPQTERIIFAEHYGADNTAKGESGYVAKCDELRGFVFEPLRAYLAGERDRAGWTTRQVAKMFQKKTGSRTVTGMAGHWFEQVQWCLPTAANYQWLRELFNRNTPNEYLRRDYEDLRRDYEYLRRDYEYLRRPFYAMPDAPHTDVWTFPTVQGYVGKHPCEKPLALLEHIIRTSSRDDTLVLDPFCGSGVTLIAARNLGRRAIGGDVSQHWCQRAVQRLARTMGEYQVVAVGDETLDKLPLWATATNAPTPPTHPRQPRQPRRRAQANGETGEGE